MTRGKRRKVVKRDQSRIPGWVHMLLGLAIGLAVALGIYVNDRRMLPTAGTPVAPATAPAPAPAPAPVNVAPVEPVPDTEPRVTFDFYEMLPNLDVDVYEEPRPQPRPIPVPETLNPGIYILQAGSFSGLEDANRRKAEIALLGVRSDIKKGTANGRTVFRVYTDPLESGDDVNRISGLLRGAGIEVLAKRVSD